MRLYLLPILAALALFGCASNTAEQTVFSIRAAYDATILTSAHEYWALPNCTVHAQPCQSTSIAKKIADGDRMAELVFAQSEKLVRDNPENDAAVEMAQDASDTVKELMVDNGVKVKE